MVWTKVDPLRMPLDDGAILASINDTTAAAAISAKQNHLFKNRTGTLEGSVRMDPAKKVSETRYRGLFGSWDVKYAIFIELGTRHIQADHFLRRAADTEFPKLGARLNARRAR